MDEQKIDQPLPVVPLPTKSWKKLFVIIASSAIGGVLLLIGAIALILFLATKGPADAAKRFLLDISSGDITKAYESMAPSFQKQISRDELSEIVRVSTVLNQIEKVSFPERSVEGESGLMHGTITGKNGVVRIVDVSLSRVNGEWRVDGLQIIVPPEQLTKEQEEKAEAERLLLNTCFDDAETAYSAHVKSECRARSLEEDCFLPSKLAESLYVGLKDARIDCIDRYPQN